MERQQSRSTTSTAETIPLTLELNGAIASVPGERDPTSQDAGVVRKIETAEGGIRLIVPMPRLVDEERANHTVALLFEQIDHLPGAISVEYIKLHSMRFVSGGVASLRAFLSVYASTVKHLWIGDIAPASTEKRDVEALVSLATAFQLSSLVSLNLSGNYIPADLWKIWSTQTKLQQLVLDQITMDDVSLLELASCFVFRESLSDLYVVLTKAVSKAAVVAMEEVLPSCRKLSSFRWINKDKTVRPALPWQGLENLTRASSFLKHIVLEGTDIAAEEASTECLVGALGNLPQLTTVKLRDLQLNDDFVERLSRALENSTPPLEFLDLSSNRLTSKGAKAIAQLATFPVIARSMGVIIMERNQIGQSGALALFESFGAQTSMTEIRLDHNPFSFGEVALNLALSRGKVAAELEALKLERDRLLKESERTKESLRKFVSGQASILADMKSLQKDSSRLAEERDLLVKAFSVIGTANQVEEQRQLLARISKLEDQVFGRTSPGMSTGHSLVSMAGTIADLMKETRTKPNVTRSDSTPTEHLSSTTGDGSTSPIVMTRTLSGDRSTFLSPTTPTFSSETGSALRRRSLELYSNVMMTPSTITTASSTSSGRLAPPQMYRSVSLRQVDLNSSPNVATVSPKATVSPIPATSRRSPPQSTMSPLGRGSSERWNHPISLSNLNNKTTSPHVRSSIKRFQAHSVRELEYVMEVDDQSTVVTANQDTEDNGDECDDE